MTPRQKDLARHALGLSNPEARGQSYRTCGIVSAPIVASLRVRLVGQLGCPRLGASGAEIDR